MYYLGDFGDHTKLRFLSKLPPEDTKVCSTCHTSLQHWVASEASLRTLCCRSLPLRAMSMRPSAIAAVTPDGGSYWMAAVELEPLFKGSGSRPKKSKAAEYGGAVAFRG